MTKQIFNFFSKSLIDLVVLMAGLVLLVIYIAVPDCQFLLWLSFLPGALGTFYICRVIYLFFANKVKFDWLLINGNFLMKVCCFVVLMPFVLLMLINIHNIIIGWADKDNPSENMDVLTQQHLMDSEDMYLAYEYNPYDRRMNVTKPSMLWTVFYHFIDPGNQHMATSSNGRPWAALIGILGVFLLNGLLVSSIIGSIDRRKDRWTEGDIKYRDFFRKTPHFVIIGGNDVVYGVVNQLFRDNPNSYILIQTSQDVPEFRRNLVSSLIENGHQDVESLRQHVVIYFGERTSEQDIKDLVLENAREVFVLGENSRNDDIESYHDTLNMRCLELIRAEIADNPKFGVFKDADGKKRDERLVCRVMFEYQTTFSVFQFYDIDKSVSSKVCFKPFNYYEMWAQKVLINKELDPVKVRGSKYLPLEGPDGISPGSDKHVHLFIVGMSRMGVAMGIEAAHLAHYPNYTEDSKNPIRTKITFIDKRANEEKDFFMGRFKELFALSNWRYGIVVGDRLPWVKTYAPEDYDYLGGNFLDIEWEFIKGGIESSAVQQYILESATPQSIVTIAVCLPESNRAHAAALYLSKAIFENETIQQILVYNRYGGAITDSITNSGPYHPYCGKLRSFGQTSEGFLDFLTESERIGKEIDNQYNTFYDRVKAKQKYALPADFGGKSKMAKKWSSIYNGNMLWTKLRCTRYDNQPFKTDVINILADVEHNRWNIEELLMNFRPVTVDQQQTEIEADMINKDKLKEKMIHVNLCSNKRLLEIDESSREFDIELSKCLPKIYDNLNKS